MHIKYPRGNLRSDYYLQPFDSYTWFALITSIITGTFFILIIQKKNPQRQRNSVDNLFLTFETICNQSGNDKMENISLRMICIALRMVAFIITAHFGAVITSFLAVEIPRIPFKNLEGLIVNNEYKLALPDFNEEFRTNYFQVGIKKYLSLTLALKSDSKPS